MSRYLKTAVASQIPAEFHRDFISSIDKGKIKKVPTWGMSARFHQVPGAILLGDALDMRHPLIGGGMRVALSDVVPLRDLLRPLHNLNDASAVCRHLQPFYTLREVPSIHRRQSCTDFFVCLLVQLRWNYDKHVSLFSVMDMDRGSNVSSETIALVAGLNPPRMNLLHNLCSTAIGVSSRLLLPFPSPQRLLVTARITLGAATIILAALKGY
ncbi:hypothetical protein HS088_TW17G00791 [Tripterygium wilfordii]|nr:hypothetical protein HS088_TW17G00791 [Tripterygium wilfordii]